MRASLDPAYHKKIGSCKLKYYLHRTVNFPLEQPKIKGEYQFSHYC
jgi:hypothetical protein